MRGLDTDARLPARRIIAMPSRPSLRLLPQHEEELKNIIAKAQHDRITNELMLKLDMLHKGHYAENQAWLNDRQSWLEREAEYLRRCLLPLLSCASTCGKLCVSCESELVSVPNGGRLGEKPAPVAAPVVAAPVMVMDKTIPLNACVAVKPVRNVARDLKSQLVTLDYGAFFLTVW